MENLNFATRWNIDEVEANYLKWLNEPNALDPNWRVFFEGFHLGSDNLDLSSVSVASSNDKKHGSVAVAGDDAIEKHARLYGAIYSFRDIGHTQGTFDPLKEKVEENPRT